MAASEASEKGVGLLESGYYDSELYDDGGDKKKRYEGYNTTIAANDDEDDDDDEGLPQITKRTYTAPKSILKDVIKQVILLIFHILIDFQSHGSNRRNKCWLNWKLSRVISISFQCWLLWLFFNWNIVAIVFQGEKEEQDPFADRRRPTIADREDEYRQKRRRFVISPERADPFADG